MKTDIFYDHGGGQSFFTLKFVSNFFNGTHIETDTLGEVLNVLPTFTLNTFSYMGLPMGEIASGLGESNITAPKRDGRCTTTAPEDL